MVSETATNWEHAAFKDFKPGDRVRFVTKDNGYGGLGIYWRTGTVAKVTAKTITVNCDRNLLGDRATIRLADWSAREPQKAAIAAADGTRFCLACGRVFDTIALLDAHQDETGHEKDASTPNKRAVAEYETATAGIPDCFDSLTGDSIRKISEEAWKGQPWTTPLKEAQTFITAHFEMLGTWRDAIDELDSEIRGDVSEGGIPGDAQQYLKQQAASLFAAQQTLLRAVAEYHHGSAGPLLDPEYGYAYQLSNSALSPF